MGNYKKQQVADWLVCDLCLTSVLRKLLTLPHSTTFFTTRNQTLWTGSTIKARVPKTPQNASKIKFQPCASGCNPLHKLYLTICMFFMLGGTCTLSWNPNFSCCGTPERYMFLMYFPCVTAFRIPWPFFLKITFVKVVLCIYANKPRCRRPLYVHYAIYQEE